MSLRVVKRDGEVAFWQFWAPFALSPIHLACCQNPWWRYLMRASLQTLGSWAHTGPFRICYPNVCAWDIFHALHVSNLMPLFSTLTTAWRCSRRQSSASIFQSWPDRASIIVNCSSPFTCNVLKDALTSPDSCKASRLWDASQTILQALL